MKKPRTHFQLALNYLLVVGLALAATSASAQLDLQRQLQHGIGATLANPSLFQDHTYTGQLISVMGMGVANLTPADVGFQRRELNLDEDRLLAATQPSNYAVGEYEAATLGVNYRRGGLQYGLSHAFRNQFALESGADLIRLALRGGDAIPSSGKGLEIWPQFEQVSYHQLGAHLGAQLSRRLSVGISTKLLLGTTASTFGVGSFNVANSPGSPDYSIRNDASYSTAGHLVDTATGGYLISPTQWRPITGSGFAIDLGVTVHPVEDLEVGVVLADLGSLRWRRETIEFGFTGTGTTGAWNGSIFDQETQTVFLEVNDSIRAQNGVVSDSVTFNTRLSPKLNLFARYRMGQATDVTFSAQAQRAVVQTTALSVGVAHHLGDFLHLGIVAGLQGGQPLFGGRISTQWYGVELYALVDNAVVLLDPYNARQGHVRIGLNLAFDKIDAGRDGQGAWFERRPVHRRGVICP